jgi:hypothetical protein
VFSAILYICVSKVMALCPRCFRCGVDMLSGPEDFLFFVFLIASFVSSFVICMGVVGVSFSVLFSILCDLSVHFGVMSVYCLLKACAMFLSVVLFWFPKVIVLLVSLLLVLCCKALMVLQYVCVLCLCDQFSKYCFQICNLCVLILLCISVFSL